MAKSTSRVLDIFTLGTASKQVRAGEREQRVATEQVNAANQAKADAEAKAAADLKAQEEENKKKLAVGNEESRRSALSNYLAQEGQQTSRRRFLVGAK